MGTCRKRKEKLQFDDIKKFQQLGKIKIDFVNNKGKKQVLAE